MRKINLIKQMQDLSKNTTEHKSEQQRRELVKKPSQTTIKLRRAQITTMPGNSNQAANLKSIYKPKTLKLAEETKLPRSGSQR